MIVPYDDSLHWRLIRLAITIDESDLDIARLRHALEMSSESELRWILGELTEPVHSHASLTLRDFEPQEASDNAIGERFYALEISTYRFPVVEHSHPGPNLAHERFFEAIASSVPDVEYVHAVSTIDVYYSAADTSWRMRLLSDAPRLEDYQAELGKISVSGVTLRFTDSPSGLLEIGLDTSPTGHEYRASVVILNHILVSELDSIFRLVVTQTEEFATLFIEPK